VTRGRRGSVYRVLVGRPYGNRPLKRPRPRMNYNSKRRCKQEVGWEGSTGMIWLRTGTGSGHL